MTARSGAANRGAPTAPRPLAGMSSLDACEVYIKHKGEPAVPSGRQEYLGNLINSFI